MDIPCQYKVALAIKKLVRISWKIQSMALYNSPLSDAFKHAGLQLWDQDEEVLFLLVTGYSSMSYAIISSLVGIAENPDVKFMAREVVRDIISSAGRIDFDMVAKCRYVHHIYY